MKHIGESFLAAEGTATVIGPPIRRVGHNQILLTVDGFRYGPDTAYVDYPCKLIPYSGGRARRATYTFRAEAR